MNEFTQIPTGVRFDPNGEEIVSEYLIPKINGCNLRWPWIAEKDVYSAEPSIVFSSMDPRYWTIKREGGATKSSIYVSVKVTKSASNRIPRRAGSGTWSGQTGSKNIVNSDSGETIGCTRMLSFKRCKNGGGPDDRNHWVMHEYSLIDSGLRAIGDIKNDIVLCKITKSVKDPDQPPPPPPPPLLSQPLGMNSLARADQTGNPPPLGFPVPDQPWTDSEPEVGFVVPMYSPAMAYQFGNPLVGFPMPDQPQWNYMPLADCIGTPVPDQIEAQQQQQQQPLYFPVVDPISNKRPAEEQLEESSNSEQKKSKTSWAHLLRN